MKKYYGKPVGNDRKSGKITFVTKYGLEKAKSDLENTIKKVIKEIEDYEEKAEFLKELAIYIETRQK